MCYLSQATLEASALGGSKYRLARGLAVPTVSREAGAPPRDALLRYHRHLRDSFPAVFGSGRVTVEAVNELSLLLTVAGSEPHLTPYLLLSHMDVVPAVEEHWSWPPFAGLVQDGYVMGRGAIDVKQTTHAILESLERRLLAGDPPRRSLLIAFGHDEEVSGRHGAARVAALLESRGQRVAFVLDEGSFITRDVRGVRAPVAHMAVTEKGYLDVKMTARGPAGHSSLPPPGAETAIGRLTRAVARLLPSRHPVRLAGSPSLEQFRALASLASPLFRLIYANIALLAPVLVWGLRKKPAFLPLFQTTTAVTIVKGGYKENVVPGEATAVINHRIMPGETKEDVLERDRRAISDPNVQLEVLHYKAPALTSRFDEEAPVLGLLAATVQQIHGEDVGAAPTVLVGSTDSIYYQGITDTVIRFDPIVLSSSEAKMMFHGKDEKISIENYHNCIQFYYKLMKNLECPAVISKLP
ncbi:N-fatty-acyl-amino acid synthase/hydrolase PM20D1-like [Pollicipes pollicipes]|uniref:N-fatty-acyl-amino acid synthase/hydrolase PM20D1-like n=1 Tax=Pollicipes pollicipes TaxID=41117 RepID=UPI00188493EE|nr:N-fatty-acyl-amino acid synthase/hydrolase PM20D1-like [Pollicipes pollicipes]